MREISSEPTCVDFAEIDGSKSCRAVPPHPVWLGLIPRIESFTNIMIHPPGCHDVIRITLHVRGTFFPNPVVLDKRLSPFTCTGKTKSLSLETTRKNLHSFPRAGGTSIGRGGRGQHAATMQQPISREGEWTNSGYMKLECTERPQLLLPL